MAIDRVTAMQVADILIEEVGFKSASQLLDRLDREITATESFKTSIARIQGTLTESAIGKMKKAVGK